MLSSGGVVNNNIFKNAFLDQGFILCQMTPLEPPFPLSWTLTLGWKNKKQLFGLIELDIEAGNLVNILFMQILANRLGFTVT